MLRNIDVLHRAIVKSCGDAPGYFVESVSGAFGALFEDDQTIPVKPQNLATNPDANTIPAQLKDAQTAAKNLETEKQKTEELQTTLNEKVSNLRDTLGVASQDTQESTGAATTQGTTNATA